MEQTSNRAAPALRLVAAPPHAEGAAWRSLGAVAGLLLARADARRADAAEPPVAWAAE